MTISNKIEEGYELYTLYTLKYYLVRRKYEEYSSQSYQKQIKESYESCILYTLEY
jgi:hypothetical protein